MLERNTPLSPKAVLCIHNLRSDSYLFLIVLLIDLQPYASYTTIPYSFLTIKDMNTTHITILLNRNHALNLSL